MCLAHHCSLVKIIHSTNYPNLLGSKTEKLCDVRSNHYLFLRSLGFKSSLSQNTKHDQNIFAISIVNDLSFCIFVILSIIEGKK